MIFGQHPHETEAQSSSYWGEEGFRRVPRGWFVKTDLDNNIWASPNQDFADPVYLCRVNEVGELVFTTA